MIERRINLAETEKAFRAFSSPLIGLPITHIWRGYGSAIFLEFGDLQIQVTKNGKTRRNPAGQMGLMIQWSWRVEGKRCIWCGSWSEEDRWQRVFARMLGAKVTSASLFGRLPEIDIHLSNGLHVLSIMTAEGDPQWALFDRRNGSVKSVSIRSGILHFETDEKCAD